MVALPIHVAILNTRIVIIDEVLATCSTSIGELYVMSKTEEGPHRGQPIRMAGTPLEEARAAVIMAHGRGATAEGMPALANELRRPSPTWHRRRPAIRGIHTAFWRPLRTTNRIFPRRCRS